VQGKTLCKSRQVFLVTLHRLFLILAAALPLAVSRPALAQLAVARPNYGVPEFAEPGGVFHSEVKAAAGLAAASWKAVLINDLRSWTGVVERAAYCRYVDNGTFDRYRLAIRVPRDISPEVFKLAISHASAGAATNRNALSVVRNIETNFYFLHYADPQARAYEPTNPDTGKHRKHGSIREILWHAPALGLIHPRFMFNTGDVAMVNSSFAAPNEGSCFTNAAAIVNGLPFTFRDGRLRFLMKYSAAGYGVENGEKLAQYDYNGRSNMAVVVKVDIARSATTRVSIRPLRRPEEAL